MKIGGKFPSITRSWRIYMPDSSIELRSEDVNEVDLAVRIAKETAARDFPGANEHVVRGYAVKVLATIAKVSNQALLSMFREMELNQSYRDPDNGGFQDLRSWAYHVLDPIMSHDTTMRLVGATLNLIAPLDAEPFISSDGEKVTGETLIKTASPSALMDLSGMFGSTKSKKTKKKIVNGLLTMGSDIRGIKSNAGWEPKVGRATAMFQDYNDDNGNPRTRINIDGTYDQARLIEKAIEYLVTIQFTEIKDGRTRKTVAKHPRSVRKVRAGRTRSSRNSSA
jgi:hypothetical protein